MSRFTSSGARRTGDDYQDLVSAEILLEWLERPERYNHVRLEAQDGSLDDVQAEQADGSLRLIQVKFATDPGDTWNWASLMEQPPGKRGPLRSSLQKWAESFSSFTTPIAEAALFTNRTASEELTTRLTAGGRLDLARCPPELRAQLFGHIGNRAQAFFEQFRFRFEEPSIEALASVTVPPNTV